MTMQNVISLGPWWVASTWLIGSAVADAPSDRSDFDRQLRAPWVEAFHDRCTGSWQERWFLDGEKAIVSNSPDGMTIDTSHGYAVLWTKRDFGGDLRIEYDFKRVDSNNRGVNIIYIQATGDGQDGHAEDISRWSDRRTTAAMSDYYLNMHTYHISYAAFPQDYIRGRRYLPLTTGRLKGTELTGESFQTGLFEDQQWIHITIIKRDRELLVEFKHPEKESLLCRLKNEDKPAITKGRVGLRLMPGRMSQFKNIRIYQSDGGSDSPDKD